MSAYSVYTIKDLSDFSGRPEASYRPYANTALAQATLLFKIGTCLAQFPDDAIDAELAKTAILAMADSIFLAQKYQQAMASPFSSESIGSYSYSKAARAVSKGEKTGIMWFDLAIDKLSVCDDSEGSVASGGIEVFENDGLFAQGSHGDVRLLGPADLGLHDRFLAGDPAPSSSDTPDSEEAPTGTSTWGIVGG